MRQANEDPWQRWEKKTDFIKRLKSNFTDFPGYVEIS